MEARAQVEQALAFARKEVQDATDRAQAADGLRAKVDALGEEMGRLEALRQGSEVKRERLATLGAERKQLEQERGQVQEEGTRLTDRLELLQTDETSACPVCRQPLGTEGRQHLQQEYEQQREALRQAYQRVQEQMKALAAEEARLKQDLQAEEGEAWRLEGLRRQVGAGRGGAGAGATGASGVASAARGRGYVGGAGRGVGVCS